MGKFVRAAFLPSLQIVQDLRALLLFGIALPGPVGVFERAVVGSLGGPACGVSWFMIVLRLLSTLCCGCYRPSGRNVESFSAKRTSPASLAAVKPDLPKRLFGERGADFEYGSGLVANADFQSTLAVTPAKIARRFSKSGKGFATRGLYAREVVADIVGAVAVIIEKIEIKSGHFSERAEPGLVP
jgi:hypothetical protein